MSELYKEGKLRREERKRIIIFIIAVLVIAIGFCYQYCGDVICIILTCITNLLILIGGIYFIHKHTERKIEREKKSSMVGKRWE